MEFPESSYQEPLASPAGLHDYIANSNHEGIMSTRPFIAKSSLCILAVLAVVFAAGCGKKSTNSSGGGAVVPPNSVFISGFAYNPTSRTVAVGTTVTWRNDDGAPHTVTSDSGNELASPTLNRGQSYSHTFNSAGVFTYHCTFHPSMHGSVTVQ